MKVTLLKKDSPPLKATVWAVMSIIIACESVGKCLEMFPGLRFHTGLIGTITLNPAVMRFPSVHLFPGFLFLHCSSLLKSS